MKSRTRAWPLVACILTMCLVGIGSVAWNATFAVALPTSPLPSGGGTDATKAGRLVPPGAVTQPLDKALNPDGTLNVENGFNGSLDTHGWRMEAAPDGGPRFVKETGPEAAPPLGDVNWDARFPQSNGIEGLGFALALIGTDVYVGGRFTTVGSITANNVVRWDGGTWSSLGTGASNGVDDDVIALAVGGANLYAGGRFTTAGGAPASRVAKWDGSAWSSLGTGASNGVNGDVYALAVSGPNVYVGGQFTSAGGVSVNNIARWDGSAWSPLGSGPTNGVNATVWSLASDGGDLYVGGDFTAAGGSAANYIARWDGSAWSTLGGGTGNSVYAIAPHGTDVYVGGTFTTVGGTPASRIARWDGSAWSALGAGLNSAVYVITFGGSDMFVGGFFTSAGGSPAFYAARWDGSAWFPLGARGLSNSVHGIGVIGGDVYVDGFFTLVGNNLPSYHFGIWHNPNVTPTATNSPTNTPTPCPACSTNTPTNTPTATPCVVGWSTVTPLPTPLLDSGVTSVGGMVYSFSGVSGGAIVANSYKYDPVDNTWTAIAPLPGGREEPSAVSDGAYIYILGGADTTGANTTTNYRYNPATNTYQTMAPFTVATWAQAAAYANGFIYKIAGCGTNCGSFLNTVEKYDIASNTWTTVAPYPQQIGWLMATGYNGQVYAAGGINTTASNKTYKYDPTTNMWDDASFPDLTVPRWGSASDVLGGQWILAGGYAPSAVSNTAIAYDFSTNTWASLHDMPFERARFGGATVGNSFYTVGGRPSIGLVGTIVVQELRYTGSCGPTGTPTSRPTQTPTWGYPTNTPRPTLTRVPTLCRPSYDYVTATGTIVSGTTDIGNHGDNVVTNITLPFPVVLYLNQFYTANVSSNGNLQFVTSSTAFTNTCTGDFETGPAIMPFWDDLRTDTTGTCTGGCGIYTSVSGSAPNRIFNIEWRTYYAIGTGAAYFEIRLYEDTYDFDIVIGTVDINNSATTGVKNNAWLTLYQCNTSIGNNLRIRFRIQGGCYPTNTPTATPTFCPTCTSTPTNTPGITITPPPPMTVTHTHTPTPTCTVSFSDVHPPDYFYVPVMYLACHGVISGYADGTFRPYNDTTRGQLCKIVVLAEGWTLDCPTPGHFTDVPPTHTFFCFIETAYSHNVISGYADGTFRPGNNVTRGQLCKIVVLAEGWADDCPTPGHFSDVPPTHTFFCFIETAYNHGIITGYDDGTFRPGNSATRGQICKIVYQAITQP